MRIKKLVKKDVIYPELSYTIIGQLFAVYNELGPGFKEKYYQKAICKAFNSARIPFKEQVYSPVIFQGVNVGKYYLDFLIDDKIALEIKSGEKFLKQNINQILSYLRAENLKLGLLVNFTREGLKYRRVLNLY